MQAPEKAYYSPEAYLEREMIAEYRSEYCNGEILPMAGGTPNHNRIAGNFNAALNVALADEDYDVFISDMRLWIPTANLYTYPDVMVVAGALEFAPGRKDTITNPLILVEVLSDSTKNYDRGEKFKFYRTIPTFQEYILVDQAAIHIEQFTKANDGKWWLSEYELDTEVLTFSAIPLALPIAVLYRKVEL